MTLKAIYVPTYRRPDKQLTWRRLPEKWREITHLVVDEQDAAQLGNYQTVVCPVQGQGIAQVRKWISDYASGTRYAVIDDDIYEFCYTRRKGEEQEYVLWNTRLRDEQYDEMFGLVASQMDAGYHMGGLDVCWNPPIGDKDIKYCNRQAAVHFYDGEKYAFEKLDWLSIPYAEDYSVILQYLTSGHKNWTSYRFRTRPTVTQSPGGCELERTLEGHNKSMHMLHDRFPDFVTLREKEAVTGAWGSIPKLAATIGWAKAYKSSEAHKETLKPESTLF